jgi:hypothetical protein
MASSNSKAARDERDKKIRLKHRYENRIAIAKYGKQALDASDYATALKSFTEYLSVIAEIKEVHEFYDLKITMFHPKKEMTEMFMISQILFEMARLYDAVPKFQPAAQKCLNLFVHVTANQPYQVLNSEMVRKSLKRSHFKNPEMFREAYQQIFVQSKKCYIVTFCYGDEHEITRAFREFKDVLLNFRLGQELVRLYYQISSSTVPACEKNIWLRNISQFIIRPVLLIFAKTFLPLILKK